MTSRKPKKGLSKAMAGLSVSTDKCQGHVMLSYQWDNQDVVKEIRDRLMKEGFDVWMDLSHMQDSIHTSMAEGVEGASVVVCCMSEKYRRSVNCERELSYAGVKNKRIIPLLMQEKYEPDGWLGLLVAGKLYYNFSTGRPYDELIKALRSVQPKTQSAQVGKTSGSDTVKKQTATKSKADKTGATSRNEHTGEGGCSTKQRSSDHAKGFDPLTATPERTFCVDNNQLKTRGDKYPPRISSLVVTGGKIVMADMNNDKVKVMDGQTPTTIGSLSLGVKPYSVALLHDDKLAVTSYADTAIHLIDVIAELQLFLEIPTARRYWGVGCGGKDDTLVVGCNGDDGSPPSVDVITREGHLLKTIVNRDGLPKLFDPERIIVMKGQIFVSDCGAHCVFQLDLATGRVMATHTHAQLQWPYQVAADSSGNMYVGSGGGRCLLVKSDDGRWRTLLRGERHGEGEYVRPLCVAVTDTGIVVGWDGGGYSVVMGFELS